MIKRRKNNNLHVRSASLLQKILEVCKSISGRGIHQIISREHGQNTPEKDL